MRTVQVDDRHHQLLARIAERAAARAGANLSALTGVAVDVGAVGVRIDSLAATSGALAGMQPEQRIVAVRVRGEVDALLVLTIPASVERALLALLEVDGADASMRASALGEIGNILAGGVVQEIAARTHLELMPDPPRVGADGRAQVDAAYRAAASDDDVVVRLVAHLQPRGAGLPSEPIGVLVIPAPGMLERVIGALEPGIVAAVPREIAVSMGELAVATRSGEVLVARGLGSCVGIVVMDRVARVAVLAHVMLPQAPERRSLGGRPTFPARYADTAIAAIVDALGNAGGRPARARAYIAGGSQMFEELQAVDQLRISSRNITAIRAALAAAGIPLDSEDVGGGAGRMLEVRLEPTSVVCHVPAEGRRVDLLDAA